MSLQLASVYGDIYTLWLGHTPVIVLSGFQAVKEVLVHHSEDFADRPLQPFLENLLGGAQGICPQTLSELEFMVLWGCAPLNLLESPWVL